MTGIRRENHQKRKKRKTVTIRFSVAVVEVTHVPLYLGICVNFDSSEMIGVGISPIYA
jgi:hypothetical protein